MTRIFSWYCRGLEGLMALMLAIKHPQEGVRSTA